MTQPRSRVLQAAAISTALAAAVVTGCSDSSAEKTGSAAAAGDLKVGTIPKITTRVDKPVPVEAYLLSDDQWEQLGKAENTLRERCMKRFGIQYTVPSLPVQTTHHSITQYRYGTLDPAANARNGYEIPGTHTSAEDVDKVKRSSAQSNAELSTAQRGVLYGTEDPSVKTGPGGQDYNGQKVPAGGCITEAKKELGNYQDAPVAVDANIDSFKKSTEDSRVRAAFAKWSACMKAKGYDYRTPMQASGDDKWNGSKVTAEEKAVAATDATCMEKYNVAGIWNAVDVALQNRAIEQKAQQLDQVKKDIQHDLKLAAQVSAQ